MMGDIDQLMSVENALLLDGSFAVRVIEETKEQLRAAENPDGGPVGNMHRMEKSWLKNTFQNCYGVFVAPAPEAEDVYEINDLIIDAAAEAGVVHIIFAMPAIQHLSMPRYSFPYSYLKNKLKAIENDTRLRVAVLRTPVFYEQMTGSEWLRFDENGNGVVPAAFRTSLIPGAAIGDMGFVIRMMFRFSEYYSQRIVGLVGDDLHYFQYAKHMLEACGMENVAILSSDIAIPETPDRSWGDVDFAGNLSSFLADRIESYGLHPGMQPYTRWLKRNRTEVASQLALRLEMSRHDGSKLITGG